MICRLLNTKEQEETDEIQVPIDAVLIDASETSGGIRRNEECVPFPYKYVQEVFFISQMLCNYRFTYN